MMACVGQVSHVCCCAVVCRYLVIATVLVMIALNDNINDVWFFWVSSAYASSAMSVAFIDQHHWVLVISVVSHLTLVEPRQRITCRMRKHVDYTASLCF